MAAINLGGDQIGIAKQKSVGRFHFFLHSFILCLRNSYYVIKSEIVGRYYFPCYLRDKFGLVMSRHFFCHGGLARAFRPVEAN